MMPRFKLARLPLASLAAALTLVLLLSGTAHAQPPPMTTEGLEEVRKRLKRRVTIDNVATKILSRTSDFELNRLFRDWGIVNDFNFKPKVFTNTDGPTGVGFSYDYGKEAPPHYFAKKGTTKRGLSFNFEASGNVSFDQAENVQDFLDTKLQFRFFQSTGGINELGDESLNLAKINGELLQETLKDPANAASFQQMVQSESWQQLARNVTDRLSTQFYFNIGGTGGIESDQSFSSTQWTAGVMGGVEVKAWNPNSLGAYLNIFDYPFAVLRYLAKVDQQFTVDGISIPSLRFGYDRVMASDSAARSAITTKEEFNRIWLESSFRTPLARFEKSTVFFDANIRYYHELSAPASVQAAGQENLYYFEMALASSNGVFISYGRGQLPFDLRNTQAVEIGWKIELD